MLLVGERSLASTVLTWQLAGPPWCHCRRAVALVGCVVCVAGKEEGDKIYIRKKGMHQICVGCDTLQLCADDYCATRPPHLHVVAHKMCHLQLCVGFGIRKQQLPFPRHINLDWYIREGLINHLSRAGLEASPRFIHN